MSYSQHREVFMDKSILRQCASLLTEIEGEEKRIQDLESEIQAMPPRHRAVSYTHLVVLFRDGGKIK